MNMPIYMFVHVDVIIKLEQVDMQLCNETVDIEMKHVGALGLKRSSATF